MKAEVRDIWILNDARRTRDLEYFYSMRSMTPEVVGPSDKRNLVAVLLEIFVAQVD